MGGSRRQSLGPWAGCGQRSSAAEPRVVTGAPGGEVDDGATAAATSRKTTRASRFSRSAMVNSVDRRGEEVVEQQEADDGGDQRRAEAADQGDRDDRAEEEQDVAGQGQLAAQVGQHQRQQRQPEAGQRRSRRCGVGGSAPRVSVTRPAAAVDLLVGDQVHVDRAGLGGGGDADAAGEDLGEPAAAAGARARAGWR